MAKMSRERLRDSELIVVPKPVKVGEVQGAARVT
jgi:hypothetical protein